MTNPSASPPMFEAVALVEIRPSVGRFRVDKGATCFVVESFAAQGRGIQAEFFEVLAGPNPNAARMIVAVHRRNFTVIRPTTTLRPIEETAFMPIWWRS